MSPEHVSVLTLSLNSFIQGFPDISAQSNRFVIYYQGRLVHIGGTSASAPTIGGIVALLNDARISQGKSPLGFLNPFLYGNAVLKSVALNDITTGNNPGCGTTGFNVCLLFIAYYVASDSVSLPTAYRLLLGGIPSPVWVHRTLAS